jgi:hypothetical protein
MMTRLDIIREQAWGDWLHNLDVFDRALIMRHELVYHDAWVDGEMTLAEICDDAGVRTHSLSV